MSELAALADFIVSLHMEDFPEAVKEAAVFHVLDSIGTAVGAATDEQVRAVTKQWLMKDGGGRNHIWGTDYTASLSTSVFLNAMMGHTQEMDDVHTNSKTHIGTVVVPAAWGVAEYMDSPGRELLSAVVCGYEIMSRIGMAFGVSAHRNRGWHVTATAGTFGAAAAAGRLLKLDRQQMIYALGLAGAQSFGTWAFLGDGATCKTLNPARASQNGVEAALLAKAGMTGPEHILTSADGGILSGMSDAPRPELAADSLGSRWQILEVDHKPYPSCRSTHCVIDAALELREKYQINPEEIGHVEVETYLIGYKQCGASEGSITPMTPVHAKFSAPYALASALIYGEMTLAQLKVEVIQKPDIQKLLHKVRIIPTDEFTDAYPRHWGCRVIVHMQNGDRLESCIKDASGSVDRPLTRKQVREKAVSLMGETVGKKSQQYADAILKLADQDRLPVLN